MRYFVAGASLGMTMMVVFGSYGLALLWGNVDSKSSIYFEMKSNYIKNKYGSLMMVVRYFEDGGVVL